MRPESRKERNFKVWSIFLFMPRLRNLPPYESNDIVRWFAKQSAFDIPTAYKFWQRARGWSKHSKRPCLIFDPKTRQWHGVATQ